MEDRNDILGSLASKVSRTATSLFVVYIFFIFYIFSFNFEISRMNQRETLPAMWGAEITAVVSRLRAYKNLQPYLTCELYERRDYLIVPDNASSSTDIDRYIAEIRADRINLYTYFDDLGQQCLVAPDVYYNDTKMRKILNDAEAQIDVFGRLAQIIIGLINDEVDDTIRAQASNILTSLQRDDFTIDFDASMEKIINHIGWSTGIRTPTDFSYLSKWIVDGERVVSTLSGEAYGADYFTANDVALQQSLKIIRERATAYLRVSLPDDVSYQEILELF